MPTKQMTNQIEIEPRTSGEIQSIIGHLIVFFALCSPTVVLAGESIRLVLRLVLENDTYTHIPLIPIVTGFLMFNERRRIFSRISYWYPGISILAAGSIIVVLARLDPFQLRPSNQICLVMLGLVLSWIGAFAVSWGKDALKASRFPLLFLIFMVPIPEPALSDSISLLQQTSAKATAVIFGLYGIPYLQEGLVFSLPGIAIRIAEECSGIRSTLALLIITVLASHFYLKKTWKQVLVCILVIPLSIAKNGLRIATLSALAIYVDKSYLTGPIHHEFGGVIFFGAAFIPLALIFLYFQKTDRRHAA